jgi:hypothetical protein
VSNHTVHQITFRDGFVMEQQEPEISLDLQVAATVVLDGQVMQLGLGFARLLAERQRLAFELDKAKTELADMKSERALA